MRGVIVLPVLLSLAAVSAAAEPPSFLPEAFARLRAARYVPADRDQVWTGWIGAGADLLRIGRVTAELTADVETIIPEERCLILRGSPRLLGTEPADA